MRHRKISSSAIAVLAFLGFSSVGRAEEWPGWRGLERHGRIDGGPKPLHWSPDSRLAWKTKIPGSGFSSPVVSQGSIYLTTCYPSERAAAVGQLLQYLNVVLAAVLAVAAVRAFLARSQDIAVATVWSPAFVRLLAFGAVAVIVMAAVLFAPNVFDYQRCPIRRWLGSTLSATAVLLLAAMLCRESALRLLLAALLIVLGAATFWAVPERAHAYRGGWFSLNSMTVTAVAAAPLFAGCLAATRRGRGGGIAGSAVGRPKASGARLLLYRFLCASAAIAAVALVARFAVTQADRAPGEEETAADFIAQSREPAMMILLLASLAGAAASSLLARRIAGCAAADRDSSGESQSSRRWLRRQTVLGAVRSVAGLTCAFLATILLLNRYINGSTYLRYHLGGADWTPVLGWLPTIVAFVAILGIGTFTALASSARRESTGRYATPGICLVGAGLAASLLAQAGAVAGSAVYVRSVLCLDADTGEIRWEWRGLEGGLNPMDRRNSQATPTPVVEKDRIFAYFGSAGLACVDRQGKLVWSRTDVEFNAFYGVGSSPIVKDGVVVVVNSPNGYVCAVDAATGSIRWRREMEPNPWNAWARTPVILRVQGKDVVAVWNARNLEGYDLASGVKLWDYPMDCGRGDGVTSMVVHDDTLFCAGTTRVAAVAISSLGAPTPVMRWEAKGAKVNCVSPVVCEGRLFAISDLGALFCFDLKTGRNVWRTRLAGEFLASPVAAGKCVYFVNTDGVTTVVSAGDEFSKIAENDLAENVKASFAPSGDALIVRTYEHLMRIPADAAGE